MSGNSIVGAVGTAFVQQVQTKPPGGVDALKAEFDAFSSQLNGSLKEPLAEFVSERLAASPETAWMADVLTTATPSAPAPSAQQTLQAIKDNNARVHDKSASSGVQIGFGQGGKSLDLAEAKSALEKGETVNLTAMTWTKASGLLKGTALLLGGSYPTVEGVGMSAVEVVRSKQPVSNPSELAAAWQDVQLLS